MKMRTMIALAASLLLTACAAPAEEAAPAADGEAWAAGICVFRPARRQNG